MNVQLDTSFFVFGFSAVLVIVKIVDILKTSFGVQGKGIIIAALVVSIILGVGNQLSTMNPTFETWFRVIFYSVFAAVGAMEGYDAIKARKETLELAKVTAELKKVEVAPERELSERVAAAVEPTSASITTPPEQTK